MQANMTIGCDPEVFLEDEDGNIISAVGKIGGTKKKPLKVLCGALQEDNVLGEFNTDPATTFLGFRDNIRVVMKQLESKVSPLKLKVLSSHHFTKEILKASGKQALTFGCDPDLNAWDGQENDKPSAYTNLRTAGGHVHVGFAVDPDDNEARFAVVQLMDVYLGIPSVLMDGDTERRSMYGQAGACRLKPYGVEYRTLSNFWLKSDEYIEWVYNQTKRAVENREYIGEVTSKYGASEIQRVINESDVEKASLIVDELQLDMV